MKKSRSKAEVRLAIVGSEGAKFTKRTEARARELIRGLFARYKPVEVVSGACHLGGIDIWAVEEAREAGIRVKEYPPAELAWDRGYKPRNIRIAQRCTVAVCITVAKLPKSYDGLRFGRCYHCNTDGHIKSGGCWTTKYARSLGKKGYTIIAR